MNFVYSVVEPDLGLEESPKWHLLSMVLDEIQKETKSNTTSKQCICLSEQYT